ncbi:hypothetical protein GCM10009823_10920 [Brevibacterium salitolerans]|uniref:Uncharacterized protein n=1 Tax=Brevibacterium salitolerans TaxID=1403566 RepID=A0ABN2WIM5_9MICO
MGGTPSPDHSALSPEARAAIAKYRRLLGNRAEPEESVGAGEGDPALARYLAERPPHHSPPSYSSSYRPETSRRFSGQPEHAERRGDPEVRPDGNLNAGRGENPHA